jgi:ribosomal protein S18 acetylase RimI-like enzyme
MDGITIREATSRDVKDILAIAERGWNRTYSDFLSQETIDTAMAEWYDSDDTQEYIKREDVTYFVAENSEDIVGYISGGPSDEENVAYLGALYVDPNYWREGAGTALLEEFEAFCCRENYDRIQFNVLTENNVGTSFYEKHGYEVIEEQETEVFGESTQERVYSGSIGKDSNSA